MKRLLLFGTALLFPLFFFSPSVFAYDYGDKSRSSLLSLDLLAEVQERRVLDKGESLNPCCEFKGDAVSTRLLAKVGLRPVPPLEVYGLIGGADLSIDDFDGFDAKMNPAYGGGIHLVLFESPSPGESHLFLDYAYLQFTPKDRHEVSKCVSSPCDAPGNSVATVQDEKIQWREHVVKIGGDFRHDVFRPYGGLRVSFVRGRDSFSFVSATAPIANPNIEAVDLVEDNTLGVFGGVDIFLDPTDALALNLEVSLFDVNSIRGGLRFAF